MSEMPKLRREVPHKPLDYDALWRAILKMGDTCTAIRNDKGLTEQAKNEGIDRAVQAWMLALEDSERFAAVIDILPASPSRQTGDRLFLADDGSSFVVVEPHPFRGIQYRDNDIQDPKRDTFFLPPDVAEQMRAETRQMSDLRGLFKRTWRSTDPFYGMVPFQVNAEAMNVEIIPERDRQGFSLSPTKLFTLHRDNPEMLQQMVHLSGNGIAEVRLPRSRQNAQAA